MGKNTESQREHHQHRTRPECRRCAAGYFGSSAVISADEPENVFFVTGVDGEGDIEVSTVVYGIVKIIKTQDFGVIAHLFIIMKLNHITGAGQNSGQGIFIYGA